MRAHAWTFAVVMLFLPAIVRSQCDPPAICGDDRCTGAERCDTCADDCGVCHAQPGLPIAVPDCVFPAACCGGDCTWPPVVISSIDANAAWTAFFSAASENAVRSYLHFGPCDPPGNNQDIPVLALGDSISLTNGVGSTTFQLLQCMFQNGFEEAVLPVVDVDSCSESLTGSRPVNGFVGVRIVDVVIDGTTRRIELQPMFRSDVPAQPGTVGCP